MQGKPSLESVVASLRDFLPELRERYRVEDIGVFGSYVREGEDPGDLDVLITFSDPPSLIRFIELENLLSDRLGVRVDLVMRDALKPHIGSRILRELVPV
jgi:predicted nucleotidyltransferase